MTDKEGGLEVRMAKMMNNAAYSTLFTTLTSAAAFASSTLSDIPAISGFGLLTALVIIMNYVLLLLLIPTSIGFWWRYLAPLEAKVYLLISCQCFCKHANDEEGDEESERV
jgi:hypothetical protein